MAESAFVQPVGVFDVASVAHEEGAVVSQESLGLGFRNQHPVAEVDSEDVGSPVEACCPEG